jgi:hypothetical protein
MSDIVHKYLSENYPDFHWEMYRVLNKDLLLPSKLDYEIHFLLYGLDESRKWRIRDILPDFDWHTYKRLNPQLGSTGVTTKRDYELHYLLHGLHQKLPHNDVYNSSSTISESVYQQLEHAHVNNILVILPGFGEPHLELKVKILEKNIETLAKSLGDSTVHMRILVFLYTIEKFNYLSDRFRTSPIPVTFLPRRGIVGEFIHKHIDAKLVNPFDYVFFILDDIELNPSLNIKDIVKQYINNRSDILSFPLTEDSPTPHEFMRVKHEYILAGTPVVRVNFMEFFCYFMNVTTLMKFKRLFSDTTYWLWGLDLALHPCGFNLIRLEHLPARHYLKSSRLYKNLPDPHIELQDVRSRYPTISEKRVLSAHNI